MSVVHRDFDELHSRGNVVQRRHVREDIRIGHILHRAHNEERRDERLQGRRVKQKTDGPNEIDPAHDALGQLSVALCKGLCHKLYCVGTYISLLTNHFVGL